MTRPRRTRRIRGNSTKNETFAPAWAPSTAWASSTMSNAVGINRVSAKGSNYKYKINFGVAPPHEEAGGLPGLRLHVKTSKHYLIRSASAAKFIWSDGTNYFQFLSMNPLVDAAASHSYSPILGAGSPAAKIAQLFVRYAVRSIKMTYQPSRGFQETGTYGMVYRPDVEETIDTFAEVKNSDGYFSMSVNKQAHKAFIETDLRKPATELYFVDETKISDKDRSRMGYIVGASQDLQASADLAMGDIVFEVIYDLYNLSGDPSPAYTFLQTLLNLSRPEDVPEVLNKYLSFIESIPLTKKLGIELVRSYVSENFENEKKKDSKESKEVKNDNSSSTSSIVSSIAKDYVVVNSLEKNFRERPQSRGLTTSTPTAKLIAVNQS